MKGGDYIITLPDLSGKIRDFYLIPPKHLRRSRVKDILNKYFDTHASSMYASIFKKVLDCMTGNLGFHVNVCDTFSHTEVYNNPCSSELCPDCQRIYADSWIKRRYLDLLAVPYYHMIFRLLDDLTIFAMFKK